MYGDTKFVSVRWKQINSYDEASSNLAKGIYIHDWDNKPYYVGQLKGSTFGTRYNSAYRHWIDGCLKHGARLYIGSIGQSDMEYLDEIENSVIQFLNPSGNRRRKPPSVKLKLAHEGQVPKYLLEV